VLEQFKPPSGVALLQNVDDLLISREEEGRVKEAMNELLNFWGQQGLRVSNPKLHYVETEVKYLGHLVSEESRKINPERTERIVDLPLPETKRELRKFW
ncbi:POL5 protein, partial [Rhinoptilus africanus]|nr:POL5 protein [Rhinoptilus africanus]